MSNKKLGNHFESELCEILSYHGFWVHNLAQNSAEQPADVIAVKNDKSYLIDCKVCSNGKFAFSRIEDNQELAMELWKDCGNGLGWFALKFREGIYMVDMGSMINARNHHSELTQDLAEIYGYTLEEWLWIRKC
jgi:Holliday junction resolvase